MGRTEPAAVLLDLDGTLLDHRTASAQGLRAATGTPEGPAAAAELRLWRALEERHFQRYLDGLVPFDQQRVDRVTEFSAAVGVDVSGAGGPLGWFRSYLEAYEAAWVAFPDVGPTLEGLDRAGVALAVVTNGDADQQRRKLRRLGLDLVLVASSEAGARKPQPRIFHAACERVGAEAARCVVVGDDVEVDARGAARAGLHGVWLDRDGGTPAADVRRISVLTELLTPARPGGPRSTR